MVETQRHRHPPPQSNSRISNPLVRCHAVTIGQCCGVHDEAQLTQPSCKFLCAEVGVSLEHRKCLVAGDTGNLHRIQAQLEEPAYCLMAEIMPT